MNNNRSIKWKTSTFSRNGTTQYSARINGTTFTIHKSNEKDWIVRLGDSDGKLIHVCDTLKLAKRWCDFDAHNKYSKKNEEYINAMLDEIIEDTTRMPRSVHPLYWTNKVGSKRLGDNPKSVAAVNQKERNKLAKSYRVGRNTQVHKREVVTRKDKKEKNSRVEYLAGKNTLIAQRARKTPTIYLNKNEEIDAFLDETMRRARSSPASEWDRLLNKRKRQDGSLADKRKINIGMRKERAAELNKIRKEKNTKGIEYAKSYIQRNTADPDYAKHTKRHNSLKEIDAFLDETIRIANYLNK